MELNELKSAWNAMPTTSQKKEEEIKLMFKENNHPVLKKVIRQLILETTLYIVFLACYYSMLDGAKKPLYINILLVVCTIFPILHNVSGYRFFKQIINAENIKNSLQIYLQKAKRFAWLSVASRILFASGLLLFLVNQVNFTEQKRYSLILIIAIFAIQLFFLLRLWQKRITHLKDSLAFFQ